MFSGSTGTGIEKSSESLPSVESWLETINLLTYKVNFETNLYTDMDRVTAIWDDELTSILDIEKIGHRKRILLSLAGRDGIQHRFGKVKACTFYAEFTIQTLAT